MPDMSGTQNGKSPWHLGPEAPTAYEGRGQWEWRVQDGLPEGRSSPSISLTTNIVIPQLGPLSTRPMSVLGGQGGRGQRVSQTRSHVGTATLYVMTPGKLQSAVLSESVSSSTNSSAQSLEHSSRQQ